MIEGKVTVVPVSSTNGTSSSFLVTTVKPSLSTTRPVMSANLVITLPVVTSIRFPCFKSSPLIKGVDKSNLLKMSLYLVSTLP